MDHQHIIVIQARFNIQFYLMHFVTLVHVNRALTVQYVLFSNFRAWLQAKVAKPYIAKAAEMEELENVSLGPNLYLKDELNF